MSQHTVGEIAVRVSKLVEDPNGDIYGAPTSDNTEMTDAIGTAKDEVLSLVLVHSKKYPQTSEAIAFTAGTKEVAITTPPFKVLYAESTPTGGTKTQRHNFGLQQDQDEWSDTRQLYLRRISDGTVNLGRRYTDDAVTVTVFTVVDVADITIASGNAYTFGPTPADVLIQYKAAIILLLSRGRKKDAQFWMLREAKVESQLAEILQTLDATGPRHVRTTRESRDTW